MKSKNSLHTLLGMICLYTLITSSNCKKDDEPSVYEKMQGRWNFTSATLATYNNNTNALLGSQTFGGLSGDYVEFRTDNKIYLQILGTRDTSGYRMLNDTRFIIEDGANRDSFDIITLTANDFVFRNKEIDNTVNPPERDEVTYNLKK
jgi:hypothetical protein